MHVVTIEDNLYGSQKKKKRAFTLFEKKNPGFQPAEKNPGFLAEEKKNGLTQNNPITRLLFVSSEKTNHFFAAAMPSNYEPPFKSLKNACRDDFKICF